MAKFIILGDPHVGKSVLLGKTGIGQTLNSRVQDQLAILDWTLDQAIQESADIITTGDVFEDPRPSPTLISLFISWLKRCTDNEVSVHIIKGNHDIIRTGQHQMSAFDIISAADMDGVYIHNDIQTLETPGMSLTLLPFRDRRSFNTNVNSEALQMLQDRIAYERCGIDGKNIKVAIGHFAIAGSLPVGDEIDDMHNELFLPLSTLDPYDFSFFGHIHKPQMMRKSSFVYHIGSMDLSNFSENTHHKVIALLNSENPNVYDLREVPSRPLKQVSVSVPATITDTTAYVVETLRREKPNLSRALVRMNIFYESPDLMSVDRPKVEEALLALGAFHVPRMEQERKVVQVKRSASLDLDSTVNELTAIKMFAAENIAEEDRDDFVQLASSIVNEVRESNATS